MPTYIEREAIIKAVTEYYAPMDPDQPMTLTVAQIDEVVQNIPPADVAEVEARLEERHEVD